MNKKLVKLKNDTREEIEDLNNRKYRLEMELKSVIEKLENAHEVLERLEGKIHEY